MSSAQTSCLIIPFQCLRLSPGSTWTCRLSAALLSDHSIPLSLRVSSPTYVNLSLERNPLVWSFHPIVFASPDCTWTFCLSAAPLSNHSIPLSLPVSSPKYVNLSLELLSDHLIPSSLPSPAGTWTRRLSAALLSDHSIPLSLPISRNYVNLSPLLFIPPPSLPVSETTRLFTHWTIPSPPKVGWLIYQALVMIANADIYGCSYQVLWYVS